MRVFVYSQYFISFFIFELLITKAIVVTNQFGGTFTDVPNNIQSEVKITDPNFPIYNSIRHCQNLFFHHTLEWNFQSEKALICILTHAMTTKEKMTDIAVYEQSVIVIANKYNWMKIDMTEYHVVPSAVSIAKYLCNKNVSDIGGWTIVDLYSCIMEVGLQVAFFRQRKKFWDESYVHFVTMGHFSVWLPTGQLRQHLSFRSDFQTSSFPLPAAYRNLNSAVNLQMERIYSPEYVCAWRHTHIEKENEAHRNRDDNDSNSQCINRPNKGAIVILAQAGKHSSYGERKNSLDTLMQTLDLLYKNYNNEQHDDVWIFHEGDFTSELQNQVRMNRMEIRFFLLSGDNWDVYPPNLATISQHKVGGGGLSVGSRKMMRLFAIRLWHIMHMLGYTWVMRLDDDSLLLSPIRYNIFAFMEQHGYQYAYRNVAVESPGYLFWDFIQSFVHEYPHHIHNISHLMDSCGNKESIADFSFSNCGHMSGFYNNFFVANVTRWLQPDVQDLLHSFDDSGMIFLEHWSDLPIQSVVVRLLFREDEIHRFVGWSYAHFSGSPLFPRYGLAQGGTMDEDQYENLHSYFPHFNLSYYRILYDRLVTLSGLGNFCKDTIVSLETCTC